MDPAAPGEGGQGPHRPVSPVGRGDRRGVPRARLGQVPGGREEPAHRPPDAPGGHRAARRGQGDRGRRPHPRLVHPGGPQAVPPRRLVLDPRARRGSGDRLAGRLPLPRVLRPVRGAHRPGTEGHRGQRAPPGRLGAHPVRRGLVPALPAARGVRPGGAPAADALGRPGRLAGDRRRRRPGPRPPEARPARAAARRARHRRRLPRRPLRPAVAVDGQPRAGWATQHSGDGLRLACLRTPDAHDLRKLPHVLTQRLPGAPSVVEVDLELHAQEPGARAGLAVLGDAYCWIGLRRGTDGTVHLVHRFAEQVAEAERDAGHSRPAPGGGSGCGSRRLRAPAAASPTTSAGASSRRARSSPPPPGAGSGPCSACSPSPPPVPRTTGKGTPERPPSPGSASARCKPPTPRARWEPP